LHVGAAATAILQYSTSALLRRLKILFDAAAVTVCVRCCCCCCVEWQTL